MRHFPAYGLGLQHPFLQVARRDVLTLADAFEHFLITGESGAGKTSGPGRALLTQYMRLGFGMVICTYKSDEVARAMAIARATGREESVLVVAPGGPWKTNVLDFELSRPGAGAGLVENATALLMEVLSNNAPQGKRESKDSIWDEAASRLIRHGMMLVRAAGGRVTMDALKAIVDGIPDSHPSGGLLWPPGSSLQDCLARAKARGADAQTVRLCETYFCQELTRPGGARFVASVIATFQNMTDVFQSGPVKELFLAESPTFTVDFALRGAIVILALPVSEFGAAGRAAQLLYKAAFINAALRRQGLERGRPVALFMDEYQTLATSLDAKAMQAGRSSWLSVCALTQNLPNMYAVMEAGRAHDVVDSMVANFGAAILCRSRCSVTAAWASRSLGKGLMMRRNGGVGTSEGTNAGRNHNTTTGGSYGSQGHDSHSWGFSGGSSSGWSESISMNSGWREERDVVLPEEVFVSLSGGGPPSYRVTSVLVKAGKKFRANGGRPFLGVSWPQR